MPVSMQRVKQFPKPNWRTNVLRHERKEAVTMWNDGFDTYDISQALNIYEAVIFNNLPKWRGKP